MKFVANKFEYRRNLPHYQKNDRAHFVTFATAGRQPLAEEARDVVLAHCRHDDGKLMRLHACVVMPDHVHLVFTPMLDDDGEDVLLRKILQRIKSTSAHALNRLLQRHGPIWQDESFDHVLRSEEKLADAIDYVCLNPVRCGLVKRAEEYPWLWSE